jgi:plastocyanin
MTQWALAAATLAQGCSGCSVTDRTVTINFTVNGQSAADACSTQGAGSVVARGRWTSGENNVGTASERANCSDGTIKLKMGANGTIQLTTYESDDVTSLAMGVSAPVSVTLNGVDTNANSIDVDIVPLRGKLHVHALCTALGGSMGSCAGKVQTSGTSDGGSLAPTVSFLLDTNGVDLETVDTKSMQLMADDGHLVAETNRARVDASNVVRVTAYATDGTWLRGEASVRLTGLETSVEVELDNAVTVYDAGFISTDAGTTTSSSGGGVSSSAAGSSSTTASSAPGTSSSAAGASSVGTSSSAAAPSSSAAAPSSSTAAPSSSTAAPSSSAAAPSSSAAADSSSAAGSSSSAAATVNNCDPPTATDLTGGAPVTVEFGGVNGNAYNPPCIRVSAGTVVTFSGAFVSHPLAGGADGVLDPTSPIPSTNSGTTLPVTFPSAGTFPYYCTVHQASGMQGAVFVQ